MKLHTLTNTVDRPKAKRVGRGPASLAGKNAGRGQKGYGARTGSHEKAYFEGGQIPLFRRLPKRGFKSPFHKNYSLVNISLLESNFESGAIIDREMLLKKGLIADEKTVGLKVLATGDLTKSFKVTADKFSVAAIRKIEEAGGSCTVAE